MNFYIYPDNLKSAPMLFLWRLKDLAVIGTGALISVFALMLLPLTSTKPFSIASAAFVLDPNFSVKNLSALIQALF